MTVVMPQIGMTMTEGTINKWFAKDGDHVEKGAPLLEISTEKLTNEIEAPASGIFKALVAEGQDAGCGEPIAEIEE